jgi:hypothetical protein
LPGSSSRAPTIDLENFQIQGNAIGLGARQGTTASDPAFGHFTVTS